MVKRLSVLMLYLALVEPGCTPTGDPQTRVSSSEARQLVRGGATLLDVRTLDEFSRGHIDDARNIPVSDLARRISELPRDRPVVVYCLSGARSARAAETLRHAGYRVRDLGPMSAW